jgi:nucleoid DNA-binding protein
MTTVTDKSDFIRVLADRAEMSVAKAEHTLNTALLLIEEHLHAGGSVRFKGFGVFSARNHAARQGRNPLTGVAIDVPARRQVHFKPSPSLRTAMENVG